MSALLPLPADEHPLFLHLDIDVRQTAFLLKHHDLENYLTPLFGVQRLDASRFVLVTARKFVGGGSKLLLGTARPAPENLLTENWPHFAYTAHVSLQLKAGKENLRNYTCRGKSISIDCTRSRSTNCLGMLPSTELGFAVEANRRLYGAYSRRGKPLAPNDDRIVSLDFHRGIDNTIGNNVIIHMWWRTMQQIT
jgi:hypothetical protein